MKGSHSPQSLATRPTFTIGIVGEDIIPTESQNMDDLRNVLSIGTAHKGGQQDVWSLFCKLKESKNGSIFIAWLV